MNSEQPSSASVVEVIDVVALIPPPWAGRQTQAEPFNTDSAGGYLRENPVALVLAAGTLGMIVGALVAARFVSHRTEDFRSFSRSGVSLRGRPVGVRGDGSLKAHGDKLGSAMRTQENRAPTYPEG